MSARLPLAIVVGLALAATGCSMTNVSDLVGQLAKDPSANCVSVGTVYGTLYVARGTPETDVTCGSIHIVGKPSGTVAVPVTVPGMTLTPSVPPSPPPASSGR